MPQFAKETGKTLDKIERNIPKAYLEKNILLVSRLLQVCLYFLKQSISLDFQGQRITFYRNDV